MRPAVYRIETPRLVIRCWSPEDAALVKAAEDASREHLSHYMLWAARGAEPLADVTEKLRLFRSRFDRGEDFMYGAFDRSDPSTIVGGTGIHARVGAGGLEIGYWVHVDHVRRGIATEMASALTRAAFEIGRVRFVEIRTAVTNVASAAIPRHLGFTHEATLRSRIVLPSGAFEDELIFSMFAADYPSSAAKRMAFKAFGADGQPLA